MAALTITAATEMGASAKVELDGVEQLDLFGLDLSMSPKALNRVTLEHLVSVNVDLKHVAPDHRYHVEGYLSFGAHAYHQRGYGWTPKEALLDWVDEIVSVLKDPRIVELTIPRDDHAE